MLYVVHECTSFRVVITEGTLPQLFEEGLVLIREVALRDQAIVNRKDFDGRIESFSSSPATHYDHSRKNPSLKFGGLSDEARLFIDYDWHNPSLVIDKRTDNIDL